MRRSHVITGIKYARKMYSVESGKSFLRTEYLIEKHQIRETTRRSYNEDKEVKIIPIDDAFFDELCQALDECIESANCLEEYIDDCSVTITIYRAFGRKETMDRGLGNGTTDVGTIITRYVNLAGKETHI